MWIAAKWFERFVCSPARPTDKADLAEFGAFEANVAEAVVLDQGADFVFTKWGARRWARCAAAIIAAIVCRRFPQPSRGQLRRVCVRATSGQVPEAEQATWVADGRIWQCALLALPTAGNELSATRLLVALLFAPHPMFADAFIPNANAERPAAPGPLATHTIFPNP